MIDGASLGSILALWLAVAFCGLLAWPLASLLFPTDADRGYLAAKPIGWIVGAYTAWLAAVFGIPFAQFGWIVGLGCLILAAALAFPRTRKLRFPRLSRVLGLELGFLLLLILGALIKARVPDIQGLEKFMDFAFVQASLRTATMPPPDPWWAGEPINYYYFGHVASAWIIGLARIPADHGFNLMIGLLFAFSGTLAYRIVADTLARSEGGQRIPVVSGVVAAVLVIAGGNSHSVLYGAFRALSPTTIDRDFYFPDSTRFVGFDPQTLDRGFTEMPSYGFAVGDVHAHLLNLPVAFLLLMLLVRILKREWSTEAIGGVRPLEIAALALMFGVTAMSNSWDAVSYGVLMAFVGLLLLIRWGIRTPQRSLELIGAAVLVLVLSGLVALPFLLQFKPIASSLMWSDGKTPLWQLAVLYAHLAAPFLVLILGVVFWRHADPRWIVGAAMAAMVIAVIALPEIAYVKDIYGFDHRRANTMFKFTFAAQPVGLMASVIAIGLLLEGRRWWSAVAGSVVAIPVLATLSYAGSMYGETLRNLDSTRFTLDGLGFIDRNRAADRPLLDWLSAQPPDSRILVLEASGDSYTDTSRLSALSGVPTWAGWRGHEWLWRGDNNTPYRRGEEIDAFYEDADFARACEFVRSRGITHVAIGTIEREKYPKLAERTIERLGEPVARGDNSLLIQVIPGNCATVGTL